MQLYVYINIPLLVYIIILHVYIFSQDKIYVVQWQIDVVNVPSGPP